MTPSADRLALLRAIAADPEADAPRLVLADWLDESGTTDADRARAEFVRLGCRGAAKTRIRKAEADWLAANRHRLWPAFGAELADPRYFHVARRNGRWMAVRIVYKPPVLNWGPVEVRIRMECWRGFVRRVEYNPAFGFELAGVAIAADEPLADHGVPDESLWPHYVSRRLVLGPGECGGPGPFALLAGHDPANPSADQKVFHDPYTTHGYGDPRRFIPEVAARIGRAMTSYARRQAGWPDLGEPRPQGSD
jgi:uncharacterized protein (TIGR02996 family)